MASRKSSKMSTTQRRQNLLKSVTQRSGRKYTSGVFRLSSQTMTEVKQSSGRSHRNAFFIVRNDLREALNLAAMTPGAENAIPTYYNGVIGKTYFAVRVTTDTISIGCKVFIGKAATALREWTLTE